MIPQGFLFSGSARGLAHPEGLIHHLGFYGCVGGAVRIQVDEWFGEESRAPTSVGVPDVRQLGLS